MISNKEEDIKCAACEVVRPGARPGHEVSDGKPAAAAPANFGCGGFIFSEAGVGGASTSTTSAFGAAGGGSDFMFSTVWASSDDSNESKTAENSSGFTLVQQFNQK